MPTNTKLKSKSKKEEKAIEVARQVASDCPTPKGVLMIIGGKEDKGDGGKDSVPDENLGEDLLEWPRLLSLTQVALALV